MDDELTEGLENVKETKSWLKYILIGVLVGGSYAIYEIEDLERLFWKPIPIHEAAKNNDFQSVRYNLEYGADINLKLQSKFNGMTPFQVAYKYKSIETLKYLIDRGASPELRIDKESKKILAKKLTSCLKENDKNKYRESCKNLIKAYMDKIPLGEPK